MRGEPDFGRFLYLFWSACWCDWKGTDWLAHVFSYWLWSIFPKTFWTIFLRKRKTETNRKIHGLKKERKMKYFYSRTILHLYFIFHGGINRRKNAAGFHQKFIENIIISLVTICFFRVCLRRVIDSLRENKLLSSNVTCRLVVKTLEKSTCNIATKCLELHMSYYRNSSFSKEKMQFFFRTNDNAF